MYSFGIIIWELISRRRPFAELNPYQVINLVGMEGKTLDMPEDSAPLWVAITRLSWLQAGKDRPSFAELEEILKSAEVEIVANGEKQRKGPGGAGMLAVGVLEEKRKRALAY